MPDIQSEILNELKKHTAYFERMDWKLWMIQNMIESIAKENGYTFDVDNAESVSIEEKETAVEFDNQPTYQPKYSKDWSID
jgi:hypothetical protein